MQAESSTTQFCGQSAAWLIQDRQHVDHHPGPPYINYLFSSMDRGRGYLCNIMSADWNVTLGQASDQPVDHDSHGRRSPIDPKLDFVLYANKSGAGPIGRSDLLDYKNWFFPIFAIGACWRRISASPNACWGAPRKAPAGLSSPARAWSSALKTMFLFHNLPWAL